ncbi:MmgE/PrpD family protein [Streptomyces mirabilis]
MADDTDARARHLILDGLACALVGAQLPVSRTGVEGITALDDSGSAEIIGWGGLSTSAPSAALLNSSFIQGFELDVRVDGQADAARFRLPQRAAGARPGRCRVRGHQAGLRAGVRRLSRGVRRRPPPGRHADLCGPRHLLGDRPDHRRPIARPPPHPPR